MCRYVLIQMAIDVHYIVEADKYFVRSVLPLSDFFFLFCPLPLIPPHSSPIPSLSPSEGPADFDLENRGVFLLTWLGFLSSQTDGLRRIVSQELVAAPQCPPPFPSPNASPTRMETSVVQEVGDGKEEQAAGAEAMKGESQKGFGNSEAEGRKMVRRVKAKEAGAATGASPEEGKGGKDGIRNDSYDGGGRGTSSGAPSWESHPSTSSPTPADRRSDLFGLSTEGGYLWASHVRAGGGGSRSSGDGGGGAGDEVVPYRVSKNAPLGVLLGSDPMLAKPLQQALHALVMKLLVDQEFKRNFALVFARLYEVNVPVLVGG